MKAPPESPLEEIWRIREAYFDSFNGDIPAMMADLRRRQREREDAEAAAAAVAPPARPEPAARRAA